MKQMLILAQDNLKLAKAEVEALTSKSAKLYDHILITNSNKQLTKRLAYVRFFYKLLFQCKLRDFKDKIKDFDWNKHYKYSFCIRKFGKSSLKERDLADLVWERLKNPNVEFKKPKTRFDFYFTEKQVFCGLFESKGRTDFFQRAPKERPGQHPTTMQPRLAAALVNLTGIQKGLIYDPMCGTGGILIEAAAVKLKPEGSDIDELMLDIAKKNLKHYKFKAKLFKKDATKIKKSYNFIVTDLPYSKNTRTQNLKKLYSEFLKNLKKILKTRAVIVFPSFIKHKTMIKNADLKLKGEYSYYLHKSLSRTVCVLE